MLRGGKDLGGRTAFDNLTLLHDDDPVAKLRGNPQVMGDEQKRQVQSVPQIGEQFQHLRLHRHV